MAPERSRSTPSRSASSFDCVSTAPREFLLEHAPRAAPRDWSGAPLLPPGPRRSARPRRRRAPLRLRWTARRARGPRREGALEVRGLRRAGRSASSSAATDPVARSPSARRRRRSSSWLARSSVRSCACTSASRSAARAASAAALSAASLSLTPGGSLLLLPKARSRSRPSARPAPAPRRARARPSARAAPAPRRARAPVRARAPAPAPRHALAPAPRRARAPVRARAPARGGLSPQGRRPGSRLIELVSIERRDPGELHDGVRLQPSAALARDDHERVGGPTAIAELRVDVHARRFVLVAELDERDSVERKLRDHPDAVELGRDEVEEVVVVERARRFHRRRRRSIAGRLGAAGGDDRDALFADHPADPRGRWPTDRRRGRGRRRSPGRSAACPRLARSRRGSSRRAALARPRPGLARCRGPRSERRARRSSASFAPRPSDASPKTATRAPAARDSA